MGKVFDPEHFERFCLSMEIDTKEEGKKPLEWLGSQRYFVEQIAEGLNNGIHEFVILKARQMGISTISLALDLYWIYKYKGLQGSLVTDTDDNREEFRSTLEMYIDSLPSSHKVPHHKHNRTELVLRNRSRFKYQVAGTRKKGGLGRGKAVNFLHATECSSWGDEEGLRSLVASLATKATNRLYIFESTARGYNVYYDMWETAKKSATKKAIFIGWWLNRFYRIERDTPIYNLYWDNELTEEEAEWVQAVKDLYDFDIDDEQMAWWRWNLAEQQLGDLVSMYQEFPPTEDYAFQMTGSKFFSGMTINAEYKRVKELPARYFKYRFFQHFEHTQFIETTERNKELTIWEFPEPEGVYTIGADPAYGSSEWADRFAASVWRCYADRCVKVAEYCTDEINTYEFAWVLAHLTGNYSGAILNLEINGPGQAVFNELMNLAKLSGAKQSVAGNIYDVVAGIRHYLYRRQDTMGGSFAYQWQMNQREKERCFNTLRDYLERGFLDNRSADALAEYRIVVRDDGVIGAPDRAKDDRVVADALGVIAWNDHLMIDLAMAQMTYAAEEAKRKQDAGMNILQRQVLQFLSQNVYAPQSEDES